MTIKDNILFYRRALLKENILCKRWAMRITPSEYHALKTSDIYKIYCNPLVDCNSDMFAEVKLIVEPLDKEIA